MNYIYATFDSTRGVIRAERLCKQNGIECKVIPVPRHLSSECGMALEIVSEKKQEAQELLTKEHIVVYFHNHD